MALKRGTQVIYCPAHCNGDLNHPDVEHGFVTSVKGDIAFCRYWYLNKGQWDLRTTSCSQATPIDSLVEKDTVPSWLVEDTLKWIEAHPFEYQGEF